MKYFTWRKLGDVAKKPPGEAPVPKKSREEVATDVAAFLAKGGKITVIEEDDTYGLQQGKGRAHDPHGD